jgi:FtsZ-binding cell division protein ZapB
MSTAFEKFEELESRIARAVELVKSTRRENEELKRELEELRRERDLVKNRIENLLDNLSELTGETGVQIEAAPNRR